MFTMTYTLGRHLPHIKDHRHAPNGVPCPTNPTHCKTARLPAYAIWIIPWWQLRQLQGHPWSVKNLVDDCRLDTH